MMNIINLICVILAGFIAGVFIAFVTFKLRKIDSQTNDIFKPKHHWSMGIYMNDIPQTEQNTAHLGSVSLKICERGEYSDLLVPRVGEEVSGVYYSGEDKFEMTGTVTRVFYNVDIGWIVASCKCTDIQKLKQSNMEE